MATDLCIQVLKISSATGQRSDNTIPWTKLAAPDLFIVVKSAKDDDRDLIMRVVQGNSVLESIDISRLVDASIEARKKTHEAGITPQVEQLPIFGIAKQNALALRYRLKDGQARRLQFHLQNPTDVIRIASVFESRGMEFQTQKSTGLRQDTSRPSTAISQDRLSTMQTSSPFFQLTPNQPSRPDPFLRPPLEAGSLSNHRPVSPMRPDSRFEGFQRQSDSVSQAMPPPRLFTRDENVMPREIEPNRPTTAQIYRSSTTPYHRSLFDQTQDANHSTSTNVRRHPSASLISDAENIQQSAAEHVSPPQTTSNANLQQHVYGTLQPNHGASLEVFDNAFQSAGVAPSPPSTAKLATPYTMVIPDIVEQEIPPRRELPFLRPGSQLGADKTVHARPSSASLNLPPLPRPISARKDTSPVKKAAKQASENVPARPATFSPTKRSFATFSESPKVSEPFTSESRRTRGSVSPSKTSVSSYSDASPPKLGPMNELLARKKPLLERSAKACVPRLDSLVDAPHEIVSPPGTAISPAKLSASTAASMRPSQQGGARNGSPRTGEATSTTMTEQERASLEAYAGQSQQDRAAAMDDFVMANLENPAFTKLCGDVENCWRRFALGL